MRLLLYIVIILFSTACGYSVSGNKEFDEARRLLETSPEAALSKLNSMDISEFKDSATMARWALLYAEALATNRISAPTDTIVNIAIDYYGSHNRPDEFEKASRLKGLIMSAGTSDALASARYLQKEKEFYLYKERAKRGLYLTIGFFVLLIAGGVIAWMYQRMRLKAAQNEVLMAEASGLKRQLDDGLNNIDRLETKLHGLLENRFGLIDSLCQTYYETQGTKAERKAVAEKVKSEIDALRTDSFPALEQAVNDCRDNLLTRCRQCYPGIREDEYQLLVYIASGLSSRSVSLLLGESVDVVYKRKSRLKSRLKDNVASSWPDIMTVF